MAHEVDRVWQVVLRLSGDEYKSRGDMTEEEARVVADRMRLALPDDAAVEVVRSRQKRAYTCVQCGIDTSLGAYVVGVAGSEAGERVYPPHCSDCIIDPVPLAEEKLPVLELILEHGNPGERLIAKREIARRRQP